MTALAPRKPGVRQNSILVPLAKRKAARQLYAEGHAFPAIAKQLGIATNTVRKLCKKMRNELVRAEAKATESGIQKIQAVVEENVVLAAGILNEHLKGLKADPKRISDLTAGQALAYAAVGEKEHNKLRLEQGKATQIHTKQEFTQRDINILLQEVKEVDILLGPTDKERLPGGDPLVSEGEFVEIDASGTTGCGENPPDQGEA